MRFVTPARRVRGASVLVALTLTLSCVREPTASLPTVADVIADVVLASNPSLHALLTSGQAPNSGGTAGTLSVNAPAFAKAMAGPASAEATAGKDVNAALEDPQIFIYDNYPGGIGFSAPLFEMQDRLLEATGELIAGCECERGCPSCVRKYSRARANTV